MAQREAAGTPIEQTEVDEDFTAPGNNRGRKQLGIMY
jgi:hypothetical protein